MDIGGAFSICMVWIAVCAIAGLVALGFIWLGMRLFCDADSIGSDDASRLAIEIAWLNARIDGLEAKVKKLSDKEEM